MRSIVVAIFIKDDFIQRQIDNLLALDGLGEYKVVFVQDNPRNSPKYGSEHYREKHDNVRNIVNSNLGRFPSAELYQLDSNSHPFGTCQRGLDFAFRDASYCIFLEDDVFLAKNALAWFNYFYDNGFLKWDKYKFITGESLYYDTQKMDVSPSEQQLGHIKAEIEDNGYQQYYYEISHFLTSSIFATTREIWNTDIRDMRGSINGECVLNDAIKENNWKSIFPVVPFAKDVGMMHDDGWSVAWHGKEGVRETKNVYLLADEFKTPEGYVMLPEGFRRADERFLELAPM